jgi:transcriptional regulator with XRE-family HTH domain
MAEAIDIDSGLTEAQTRAAQLIAKGWKACDVAEDLGVDESTISRWRRKAAFAALVQTINAEANQEIVARMSDLLLRSLDVIEELLDYRHNPNVKLRAAIALLNVSGLNRTMRAAAQTDVVDPSEAAG